jgi:hypothetical protein
LVAALALASCSSGGDAQNDGGGAGTGGQPDGGGVDAAPALYGGVTIEIIKDEYTSFLGRFYDAPLQPVMSLEPRQSSGGCVLRVPKTNPCGGACPTGQVCGVDNTCVPDPGQVAVGVLHVTGLAGMTRDAEPTSAASPSYQLVPTVPYPACAEGDAISVAADAFTLAATCVADLEVTSAVPVPVTSGKATHLTWKAPAKPGASRVLVEVEISHHGGYKGQIDCDVADTGTLDIPEPLVTALVALGRAGYPTVKIARTSRGVAAAQPAVTIDVMSRLELEADTGVISCGTDASPPCAAGTTCQPSFICM